MLSLQITQTLARVGTPLRQQSTRCLRRRFKKNRCSECLHACPAHAITIEGSDIVIDRDKCTECMLCAAACPTEAIELKHSDFNTLLDEISPLPYPTVACSRKEKLQGNGFSVCCGFYSHEHLLALAFLIPDPVQLNLTACRQCPSAGMLPALQQRHRDLLQRIPGYRGRVLLIDQREDLQFKPRTLGRRDLFAFWGRSAKQETARFLHHLEPDGQSGNFGEKRLPFKRRLLNRIRDVRPEAAEALQSFLYYHLNATESCTRCMACVSMCPTGALKRGGGRELHFKSELCNACGLCVEFCPPAALSLHTGYSADPATPAVIFPKP